MEQLKSLQSTFFKVIVKPGAKKTEYLGWDGTNLAHTVAIKAPPENNKANLALIKFFTKELKRPVKIVSGATAKVKLLKILHEGV